MHLRHPDWKIAVIFFTQSLYDTITNTIDMYIRSFTNGQAHYDSSSNLKILHAWGRKNKNGFYREIAAEAKGNEAPMVYVVGIEEIAENESSVAHRNKLFTALTRAKCWVKIMGVGDEPLYDEINKAIGSNGKFKFKYVKPKNESNDMEA